MEENCPGSTRFSLLADEVISDCDIQFSGTSFRADETPISLCFCFLSTRYENNVCRLLSDIVWRTPECSSGFNSGKILSLIWETLAKVKDTEHKNTTTLSFKRKHSYVVSSQWDNGNLCTKGPSGKKKKIGKSLFHKFAGGWLRGSFMAFLHSSWVGLRQYTPNSSWIFGRQFIYITGPGDVERTPDCGDRQIKTHPQGIHQRLPRRLWVRKSL